MGKKLPTTPRSRVKSALRQVWLRSRERAACLKEHGNKCACCGVKASVAEGRKVSLEVHHLEGVLNWTEVMEAVYKYLLVHPSKMQPLCKKCHADEHAQKSVDAFNNAEGDPSHGTQGKEAGNQTVQRAV